MNLMEPSKTQLNMQTGIIEPVGKVTRRQLSDMRHMYADTEAEERILAEEGDRLIYEVYAVDLPEEEGHMPHSTTIIYPGRVGDEYHMTKGHFHAKRDRAELYMGLAGEGVLLLQTGEGVVRSVAMEPGTLAYVPPYWAHRTINTGEQPFVFLAVYPGDAGHDYGTIEGQGFAQILVRRDGQPTLIDNPRYEKTR
jgi:glucose-6-phosphate isomerase